MNLTEENDRFIDYENIYCGYVIPNNGLPKHFVKRGFRIFRKDGSFDGLLSMDKAIDWSVDEDTLQFVCNINDEDYGLR